MLNLILLIGIFSTSLDSVAVDTIKINKDVDQYILQKVRVKQEILNSKIDSLIKWIEENPDSIKKRLK